jgi:diguanylate cyclase (GGDEF)-like protein/PAS domain S-box-containing protein
LSLIVASAVYRMLLAYLLTRRVSRQALERFRAIFEQSSDAILLVDADGRILDANPASRKMLRLDRETTRRTTLVGLLGVEQPGGSTGESKDLEDLFTNPGQVVEMSCCLAGGKRMDLEVSASEIFDQGMRAYSIILRDVTTRKEAQEALRLSEERYQLAMRGANDGLWDWDLLTGRMYYSARWKAMLGINGGPFSSSPEEWFGRVHPDDCIPLKGKLNEHLHQHTGHFQFEHRVLHRDGQYRWMLARGVAVWNDSGYAQRFAGSLTDIDRQKRTEEQLRYDALHDSLTGLGNRTLLIERVRHVNERKKRKPDLLYAVLFMDLDRFKQVNDTYGHPCGDQILIETSRRLSVNLRSMDTVTRVEGAETLARFAGDEFVVLLEELRSTADAEQIAQRILAVLREPYRIDGKEITISGSVGIAVPDHPYDLAEDVIRDADIAMYQAKQRGGSTAVRFTQEMYDDTAAHMQLESDLRRAVERKQFVLHYQPIYALQDDRVIGFEALVRWDHPLRGLLAPKDFIDTAEDTGLIVPMGYQVLREACSRMQAWQHEYQLPPDMIMSVNFSARQLAAPDLLARVREILENTGFESRCLWIEITESTFIENLEAVRQALVGLRKMGIRIEIDDFGMGYSSLCYLQSLPVDGFKIDRTFINNISTGGQQIVNTLVELGKNLHLVQVAEGVETPDQRDYLRKLDCKYMQGYLMSRPMAQDRIAAFLEEMYLPQLIGQ